MGKNVVMYAILVVIFITTLAIVALGLHEGPTTPQTITLLIGFAGGALAWLYGQYKQDVATEAAKLAIRKVDENTTVTRDAKDEVLQKLDDTQASNGGRP